MLALNLLKQRLLRVRPAASLTIQTPVVLRLHFPVLLMLWSALATNLHLVNVALVFLGSSFPAQDCRSGVPWFLWNWWNVDHALIARAPSVMFQFENRPTAPPVSASPANGRKKMWNCKLQYLRGKRWSSLLRRLWSTLPLRSGWTSWFFALQSDAMWVVASDGWLQDKCISPVVCFLHSIDDRPRGLLDSVFALWCRWPPVLSTSACLELSARPQGSLSSAECPQNVRTSFWKECSRGAFVRSAVRRDLAHNLPDWGLGALVVCFASLLDHLQVAEDH